MYKLSTLSDSCSGRYPEGPLQPSDLRQILACLLDSLRISEPSASSEGHRSFGVTFGIRNPSASSEGHRSFGVTFGLRDPSASSADLRSHCLNLRSAGQPPGTGDRQYLRLPSCDLGQPPVYEVMIPNSSPSRARADSDGPNPRSLYHLQPKNVSLRRRLGRAEGNFWCTCLFFVG